MKTLERQFFEFMHAREEIRLRRQRGLPRDRWTNDEILKNYKFTNVKREHDRTTYELKEEFYDKFASKTTLEVTFLNCVIFRYFGTIETARSLGWHNTWAEQHRDVVIAKCKERLENKELVFTRAYIVPNCGDSKPKHEVVCDVIDQVFEYLTDLPLLSKYATWQQLCEDLQDAVRGMGPFMAKEVVLDYVLATGWRPHDWDTWTPMGPGARRGAARVMNGGALAPMSANAALEICKRLYDLRDRHWRDQAVQLDLTDIQFQLCEFDKYMRAKRGEGTPKNRFVPSVK